MSRWQLSVAVAAAALIPLLLCDLAEAADPPAVEPRLPATGPLARAGRGIRNIVLSPFEIPATMRRVATERDPFFGLWAGGAEGVGNCLSRLIAGVVELATAPVPGHSLPFYTKKVGERASPPAGLPTGLTRP